MPIQNPKSKIPNRPLCIEHDAATLASLTGSPKPACDGIIMPLGRPGEVLAVTLRSNPLGPSWLIDVDLPSRRIVTWSGTLAEELFDRHPLTWMKPGHEALKQFCAEILPQLQAHGRSICFQPHSRHVLNDVQSCFTFLNQQPDPHIEIALAPASLFESAMLRDAEDHLRRMFETLGGRASMVVLNDVRAGRSPSGDEEADIEPVPLGDGVLSRALVLDLLRECVSPDTPIVISPEKLSQQLEWLS